MQRLLFLPTHWLSLGLRSLIAIVAPIVFLWTGISPVFDVSATDVLYYLVPMVLALIGGVWVLRQVGTFRWHRKCKAPFSVSRSCRPSENAR